MSPRIDTHSLSRIPEPSFKRWRYRCMRVICTFGIGQGAGGVVLLIGLDFSSFRQLALLITVLSETLLRALSFDDFLKSPTLRGFSPPLPPFKVRTVPPRPPRPLRPSARVPSSRRCAAVRRVWPPSGAPCPSLPEQVAGLLRAA